ncbi:Serine/threonine-protein kinase PrkC [Phycisphaerales bacterium]|nr:Serine/threonine-protein kinase PrkC [Phycisphaerales bacterium]
MVSNRIFAAAGGTDSSLSAVQCLESAARLSDEELADVIVDVASRVNDLELRTFLHAVPGLERRAVPLDAAIEMSLKTLYRRGLTPAQACDSLALEFPELAGAVRTAYALNEAMCSTGSLAAKMAPAGLTLPCVLGPSLSDGRPRYELHQSLGQGSQGSVYLAVDRALSDSSHPAWVAIKQVHGSTIGFPHDETQEAVRARRVLHPNVVRALDRFVAPSGATFHVFEYVRGGSLDSWKRRTTGAVPPSVAARIVVSVARGVQAAHNARIIHRDIKPSNILITEDGVPKVTDFGVAVPSVSQPGSQRFGSLAFVAPEQYRIEPDAVSATADVYGLGGVLYWLLTGAHPNGETPQQAIENLTIPDRVAPSPSFTRKDVDSDLNAICRRALATQPGDRYASPDALANDLELWLSREPLLWNKPSRLRRARLLFLRSPILTTVSAAAALIALVAVVWGGYAVGDAKAQRAKTALEEATRSNQRRLELNDRSKGLDGLIKYVLNPEPKDDAAAGWTNSVTFLEAVLGPRVLPTNEDSVELWKRRIDIVGGIVEKARQEGRSNEFEPLLWEGALCVWLMQADRSVEALPRIDSLRDRWSTKLEPNDPWLLELESMRWCALSMTPMSSEEQPVEARLAALEKADTMSQQLPLRPPSLRLLIKQSRAALENQAKAVKADAGS